ncbi:MAG: D-alanine--D-alanine ligase [Clostridiales bacterium]|nr:D-alanine--D-alanine ligase [Clostridiales bacterium]
MKIVVLAGGISTERDVSLISGRMIYEALKKKGHELVLIDVYLGYDKEDYKEVFTKDEDWAKEIQAIKADNPDIEKIKAMRPDGDKNFFGPHVIDICQMADIVFMALHGENGENGKIQAAFDLVGIRYTGTDYVSSALAMDKAISKELFLQNHIPTPMGFCVDVSEAMEAEPTYPSVVKVCCGGSSVGVYMVNNKEEYAAAVEDAKRYDSSLVVEQYIKGREFSVGVIDGRALPVIEIAPLQGFYDYKNKYQAGSTVETCPANIRDEVRKKMQDAAEQVYRVLRLKSYARMDFMMDEQENVYCLEANTLPGMTPTSLLPQEAAAEGVSFEELCEKLIEVSMAKYGA